MLRVFRSIPLLLAWLFWATAVLRADPPPVAELSAQYKHVLFDMRGSRKGLGDIAASYLSAQGVRNNGYTGKITLLADEQEMKRLSKMAGLPVQAGTVLPGDFRVETIESLPRSGSGPVDLYAMIGAAHGSILRAQGDFRGSADRGIPVHDRTVYINLPVYENTEIYDVRMSQKLYPGGFIGYGTPDAPVSKLRLNLASPGPGRYGSGIYTDEIAIRLGKMSAAEIESFLAKELADPRVSESTRLKVSAILKQASLSQSKVALAYGLSSEGSPWERFVDYLKSVDQAALDSHGLILITPSRMGQGHQTLPPGLDSKAKIFLSSDHTPLPKQVKPGEIWIVETETLPKAVFDGLMARSEVPVFMTGDGALSAAIQMGIPFVTPPVAQHNTPVAARLGARGVEEIGDPEVAEAAHRIFADGDMRDVAKMNTPEARRWYKSLRDTTPRVSDRLIEDAVTIQRLLKGDLPASKILATIGDPMLRLESACLLAAKGDNYAIRLLENVLIRNSSESHRLLVTNQIPENVLARPKVRQSIDASTLRCLSLGCEDRFEIEALSAANRTLKPGREFEDQLIQLIGKHVNRAIKARKFGMMQIAYSERVEDFIMKSIIDARQPGDVGRAAWWFQFMPPRKKETYLKLLHCLAETQSSWESLVLASALRKLDTSDPDVLGALREVIRKRPASEIARLTMSLSKIALAHTPVNDAKALIRVLIEVDDPETFLELLDVFTQPQAVELEGELRLLVEKWGGSNSGDSIEREIFSRPPWNKPRYAAIREAAKIEAPEARQEYLSKHPPGVQIGDGSEDQRRCIPPGLGAVLMENN
jgi:hypothetical protein